MTIQEKEQLEKYRKHYHKDIVCGPLLEYKGWNVSKYANLDNVIGCVSFHMNNDRCLNYANRYTKLIRENEKHQQYLWEALIKTYPVSKLISKFKDWCKKNIDKNLANVAFSQLGLQLPSGKIIDYVDIPDCYANTEYPGTLTFYLPTTSPTNAEEIAFKLADDLYVYGYNLANVELIDIPNKELGIDLIAISFEAKFSDINFQFNDYLYHVTLMKFLKKICKHGLVPKTQNSVFKYPERTYLFNNAPLNMITSYAIDKAHASNENQFVLLRIGSQKLQDSTLFKNGKLKFYIDQKYPNIDNNCPDAIYTYNGITLSMIDDNIVIFDIDENGIISNKQKARLSSFKH